MDNLDQLWEEVTRKLFLNMIEVHYNTWIKPLTPLKRKDSIIYLYSSIAFVAKIADQKYKSNIEDIFREILDEDIEIVILHPNDELFKELINEDKESPENQVPGQTEMDDISKYIEDADKNINKTTPANFHYKDTLNKKYTFSNFIRGKSNDLALAIATNVAENPGTLYNPFYLYGASGLGKTHLMQAIGHKILEENPSAKVIYITSENFMNEFISSITDSKNSVSNSKTFRDKYRNCDVLMIDDIQFISGKESTQEEIFHTFNSLYNAKKQIIFTSDKRPEEIKGLEERLVTRFSGGMIADIQKPDYETRVAILKHKIKMEKYTVPDNVLAFIAENITSNIRNLEGALLKVMAVYKLKNPAGARDISDEEFLEIAKQALSIEEKKQKPITLERIKEVVADYYDLEVQDLIKQNRQKTISEPRQVAMHLSRALTTLSLIKIANSFERDHATVIHGDDKIKDMIKTNSEMRKDVENITAILQNKE